MKFFPPNRQRIACSAHIGKCHPTLIILGKLGGIERPPKQGLVVLRPGVVLLSALLQGFLIAGGLVDELLTDNEAFVDLLTELVSGHYEPGRPNGWLGGLPSRLR